MRLRTIAPGLVTVAQISRRDGRRSGRLAGQLRATLFLLAVPATLMAQSAGGFHWPEGKRVALSLSFDDARASQIDAGVPILNKYKAKATFYVNPGRMERQLEGWKKAAAAGHEIASHSTSHPCTVNYPFSFGNALENYTLAKMEQDLDRASAEIERLIGIRPVTFAYPCGQKFVGRGVDVKSYVPLIAGKFLVGRGFRDEDANDPVSCDLAQILGMESDRLTFDEMKTLVTSAAARGAWLVFAGHEVGAGGRQTTQSAALEQLLRFAADPRNGVWLETVQQVARHIQSNRSSKNAK
jgi:peptidoglycan-N-acetylglucosamine deacetylase